MKKAIKYIVYVLAVLSVCACKVPYNPPAITAVNNYLVVEGLVNITDSTYIKLSRTVNISSASTTKPELKAIISIESNKGDSYALMELGSGTYAAPPLNLNKTNQYRIRIKTTNGEQYLSDFGETKVSPLIDSITFKTTKNLKIYVNTHDPNNATRYYRWDFTEAWEFHPSFNSQYISDGLHIVLRTPAQQIWDCYTGDISSNITLGTTTQLSQDVVTQQLVNTIDSSAEKISVKYSILVKQYALTQDAYNYWTLLKKNTEQLGSIFDSQPSASIGNIHCVNNPNEPVIGYISAGTVTTSRIYILNNQLPNWYTKAYYPTCGADTVIPTRNPLVPNPWFNLVFNYKSPEFVGALQIPINTIPNTTYFFGAAPECVDCTLRGSKTPPSYWR
ncbi:MAG: DUF4249 domain-containing protein [Mucilaginibacter sp.]